LSSPWLVFAIYQNGPPAGALVTPGPYRPE
jgi:hypothetical protein